MDVTNVKSTLDTTESVQKPGADGPIRTSCDTLCSTCGGTGFTVQGWTDKNGYSEDQYGPCPRCLRRVRAEAAATGLVAHQTSCKPGGACAWDCDRPALQAAQEEG